MRKDYAAQQHKALGFRVSFVSVLNGEIYAPPRYTACLLLQFDHTINYENVICTITIRLQSYV